MGFRGRISIGGQKILTTHKNFKTSTKNTRGGGIHESYYKICRLVGYFAIEMNNRIITSPSLSHRPSKYFLLCSSPCCYTLWLRLWFLLLLLFLFHGRRWLIFNFFFLLLLLLNLLLLTFLLLSWFDFLFILSFKLRFGLLERSYKLSRIQLPPILHKLLKHFFNLFIFPCQFYQLFSKSVKGSKILLPQTSRFNRWLCSILNHFIKEKTCSCDWFTWIYIIQYHKWNSALFTIQPTRNVQKLAMCTLLLNIR